jgi:putative two-component system hydrogenase maturation factor HypX/HoxX
MQILFLVSAHNSLSQRAQIALNELGHDVAVAVVDSTSAMEAAVRVHAPDLIVCPFLKTMIPESIWARHCCLIVHPGPRGDRGPSSLDWAIELDKEDWGVTVLQANGEFDAGEVWASGKFRMRNAAKSSLYRHEVRRAATEAVVDAIDRLVLVGGPPSAQSEASRVAMGPCLPLMTQEVRAIERPFTSSALTPNVRFVAAPESYSPSATARSAEPRSTARCGLHTSSARARRAKGTSSSRPPTRSS